MKLRDLLQGVTLLDVHVDLELEVQGVAYDSRKVEPGFVFVAVAGFATDGNQFISMALERGAVAVVTAEKPAQEIAYVLVDQDRLALAQLSANWYDHPAKKMTMVAVTGTNGKTSTTLLLKHVLETALGAKVGLIGTMYNMIGSQRLPTQHTTPESLELQGLFAQMRSAGCGYVIMEVSSHAIALERVGGVHFDVAAFTNLTEDHLDFHKTMEAYCDTKARLFSRCGKAVLNQDDAWYSRIAAQASCPVLTTSVAGMDAGLTAREVALLPDRVRFTAVLEAQEALVELSIPGMFSVYNAITVLGLAVSLGVSLHDAAAALKTAKGIKGRVEVVPTPGTGFTVLIDYAHTPDGLEHVLCAAREFCQGRLIAVYGCGGDRDPVKRPIMGKIGVTLADYVIITSDNPRSENPSAIIADILEGVVGTDTPYEVVENRRTAIRRAMQLAAQDDVIVLAGKGHETYQLINGIKYHLDEREEVAAYLRENEG